jgi:signal transduction histidine kinase
LCVWLCIRQLIRYRRPAIAPGGSGAWNGTMRLGDYIRDHHEIILKEWETFARTLRPAAEGMSKAGLRDHADQILTAIVSDMESLESAAEKATKSKGHAHHEATEENLGALGQLHAILRIEAGFTLTQVVAEYRALRASILRLWAKPHPDTDGVLRFNEAIDAALAEAVDRFTTRTNEYRDQLIAIVSHDLRNPLGGILLGSAALTRTEGLDDKSARLATRIQNSAKRMVRIVDDLLDLTRGRLGSEIPISRRAMDAGPVCEMVIAELEGSHPHAVIRYTSKGDLRGEWDSDRLAQVLSNLVGNALQHGDADKPITVLAQGHGEEVALAIHNAGTPIPAGALNSIFEPNVRNVQDPTKAPTGLGLGLYIAKELVRAHGGTLDVASTDGRGTTFTVRLPRHAVKAASVTA